MSRSLIAINRFISLVFRRLILYLAVKCADVAQFQGTSDNRNIELFEMMLTIG